MACLCVRVDQALLCEDRPSSPLKSCPTAPASPCTFPFSHTQQHQLYVAPHSVPWHSSTNHLLMTVRNAHTHKQTTMSWQPNSRRASLSDSNGGERAADAHRAPHPDALSGDTEKGGADVSDLVDGEGVATAGTLQGPTVEQGGGFRLWGPGRAAGEPEDEVIVQRRALLDRGIPEADRAQGFRL